MGSKLSALCQDNTEEHKRDRFLRNTYEKFYCIAEDYEYFFNQENWMDSIPNPLYDADRLMLAYNDYKYHQEKMDKHWRKIDLSNLKHGVVTRIKNEVISPKWKYLIRKGVPLSKMRTVILDIFKRKYENNDFEYDLTLKAIFKDYIPQNFKNIPSFSNSSDLTDVLLFHVLNDNGIKALKRLLWVFKETHPELEYSPLIAQTLSLLLIFLTEAEAYFVIKRLLEDSKKILDEKSQINSEELRGLRWHFTFEKEDFLKYCKSFFEVAKRKSSSFSKIEKHFQEIGFNYTEVFQEWTMNFYSGYLQFSTILKIFIAFINEGIKIHYRISYAICRVFKREIKKFNNPVTLAEELRKLTLNMDHKKTLKMFQKAYSFGLRKIKKGFSKMKLDMNGITKPKPIYLPHLETPSEVISDEKFETLWEWFDNVYKILDPKLVFSCSKHGYSLSHLYKKCEEYSDQPMLLIIKTETDRIFGAFSDQMLRNESSENYYGSNETFVFCLEPEEIKYPSKLKNKYHIHSNLEYFSFGGGDAGPAFQVDSELYQGHTFISETYDNKLFTGTENDSNFKCMKLEIYALE